MTDVVEEIRQLAKVVAVDDIEQIADADNIEVVVVGGWRVVVKKGEFKKGDQALFIEVDSCLPVADERFAFLRDRGVKVFEGKEYHRLKTIKLRGVISQGLVLPINEFTDEVFGTFYEGNADGLCDDWFVPADQSNLTKTLGILKYDDIVAKAEGVKTHNMKPFPTQFGKKTDSERVQNLKSVWNTILDNGPWIATEKIDGTSLSVFRSGEDLIVCSRNWQIDDGDNVYWNMVRKYRRIFYTLEGGCGYQAEIAGPGIQGNPLRLAEQRIFIFSYLDHGEPQPREEWTPFELELAAPVYPLALPETVEEAIAQANGIKSLVSPDRPAEGIVWHQKDGVALKCLNDRPNFKAISQTYLLKKKD